MLPPSTPTPPLTSQNACASRDRFTPYTGEFLSKFGRVNLAVKGTTRLQTYAFFAHIRALACRLAWVGNCVTLFHQSQILQASLRATTSLRWLCVVFPFHPFFWSRGAPTASNRQRVECDNKSVNPRPQIRGSPTVFERQRADRDQQSVNLAPESQMASSFHCHLG